MKQRCFVCGGNGTIRTLYPTRFICEKHFEERRANLITDTTFKKIDGPNGDIKKAIETLKHGRTY